MFTEKQNTIPEKLVQMEEQFYSLMAVLDVEQSGNSVEIPKTAPVCETRCISVSVTNRVPTQNASPKTEKFSAQKYWGLFSNQTNP